MHFENGRAEFTLKHGQSMNAIGIPEGTGYEVFEESIEGDGYVTTATGEVGVFEQDTNCVARFVNVREVEYDDDLTAPGTGGTGIVIFLAAGIVLTVAGVLVWRRCKKQKNIV